MVTNDQKAQELIIRNEYLDKQIYELLKQKKILDQEKNENNEQIRKMCNHNWVRERSYEYHNEKLYQCSKCRLIS